MLTGHCRECEPGQHFGDCARRGSRPAPARLIVVLSLVWAGLATADDGAWPLATLAAADGDVVKLGTADGRVLREASTSQLRLVYAVYRSVEAVAETQAELILVEGEQANAFAGTGKRDQPVLGINFAMLDLLGLDAHAAAALVGHELAHLKLNHGRQSARRAAASGMFSLIGGVVLGALGVPASGLLSDLAFTAVQSGYSRDDEREADYLGTIWAVEAGFEADGAVRLHETLARASPAESATFLSSHPSGPERIASLRALAERLSRGP